MSVNVLLSLAPPDGTTKYVVQLTEGKSEETRYSYFSWWTALFGRYDVFHVHWPEQLVRARNPLVRMTKIALFHAFLFRIRMSRIAVVRTLHNLNPHEEGDSREMKMLDALDALTNVYIRLNEATPIERGHGVTVLHGHYIGRYPGAVVSDSRPGRILYFGLIRPYKGVERLLDTFGRMNGAGLELRIVGRPTHELGETVKAACASDPRISARLEFVPDDVLASEVYLSELVVLPYKEMHNSGAILVALSLGRPVLAPWSATNQLLSDEVGEGWVHMYDGELTEEVLSAVLERLGDGTRSALPKLEGRDWNVVGQHHLEAYRKAVDIRRQRVGQ